MRFITIRPGGGRFGNRVIFYMAALAIAEAVGGATICGVGLPPWNIPEIPPPDDIADTITLNRPEDFDLAALAAATAGRPSFNIILNFHMQNIRQFLNVEYYRRIFPLLHLDVPVFDERHLLIHIRADDILDGSTHWYPLMPVQFFRDVVNATGKLPVFMGELQDGPYIRHLRAAFPQAQFLPQQSLMRDFDMIRQAKNILLTPSTFSWVAAWLSNASNIHLPLNGFFNPAHMRHIDLLPEDDERFQFYLFPLNYAVPEIEALKVHEKLNGSWKKISRQQLRELKTAKPALSASGPIALDHHWYLSAYPDAGMAISEGRFENAEAHYAHFGRKARYLPWPPLVIGAVPLLANVALAKPASQSSTWDGAAIRPPERDAAGAVDGDVTKAQGFHTAIEANPWWMVDLLALHLVHEVHVYNRAAAPYPVRARAAPLVLLASADGQGWTELLRTRPGELFGAERGPLCWQAATPVQARYIKIMLENPAECLHLAQVAVFGVALQARQPVIERMAIGPDQQLWRSGMKLPARAVVLAHERKRARAVCVRIGADSVFFDWFKPGAARSWDVLLSFYKLPEQPFSAAYETIIAGGLSKYTALKDIYATRPDVYDGYEQFLLLDDDIGYTFEDIDRLFDLAAAHDLDLAQASLSHDSAAYWGFLKHQPGNVLRYTNLVEVMMPLFSRAAFLACIDTFDQSVSSWGLDFVWAALLGGRQNNLAVIDAVVATHLRPVDLGGGAFYRYLQSIRIDPATEQIAVQNKYAVTRAVADYGVIGAVPSNA